MNVIRNINWRMTIGVTAATGFIAATLNAPEQWQIIAALSAGAASAIHDALSDKGERS